jgi:hypothetical protein
MSANFITPDYRPLSNPASTEAKVKSRERYFLLSALLRSSAVAPQKSKFCRSANENPIELISEPLEQ